MGTEDKLNGIDGQVKILNNTMAVFESRHVETVEKFKEVNVITNTIQTQIKDRDEKMFEQNANDLVKIKEQLQSLENQVDKTNEEVESNKKKTNHLASDIEEKLGHFEDAMDKKINTDIIPRIGHLDDLVGDFDKDIKSSAADNAKAIYDIKNQVTNIIVEKIKPTEDKINNIDGSIQDVNKTLAVFEGRHVETVEKMKEVTVLTSNIQVQMKAQEQKMIEQSSNDLDQIRDQLRDIENQAGLSDQRIQELDKGNQTFQDKVHGIESQVTDRLEDLAKSDASLLARINELQSNNTENISSLQHQLSNMDSENKNNIQQIYTLQEFINNQSEQVKKVDAERQMSAAKTKEDLDATLASNQRAIAELRNELAHSISEKLKPTEGKINRMDDQVQILNNTVSVFESHRTETVEKFKEVNVITNTIQTQIKEQEQKMLQQNSNGLNQIREQLENIESRTSVSSQEIEKGKKQTENLSRHLDAQLAIFEDVMDKKINTDIMPRIGHLDDVVADLEKDIKSSLADNAKAVYDIKNEVTNTIVEQIKPTSDKINSMDGSIQDVNKALAVFEGRHVETVEKMKEVTLLSNNTQIQMKDLEQKMIEQSANGLNDIREQLLDIVNRNNASSQEIEAVKKQTDNLASHLEEQLANFEDVMDKKINSDIMPRIGQLDKVNQNLVEQLLGFETDFEGKFKKQEEKDDAL